MPREAHSGQAHHRAGQVADADRCRGVFRAIVRIEAHLSVCAGCRHVLEQWRETSGIDAFVSGEFEESLDQVSQRSKGLRAMLDCGDAAVFPCRPEVRVDGDAVDAVRSMKEDGDVSMATIGSLSVCRSLLKAGLVDRISLHTTTVTRFRRGNTNEATIQATMMIV